MDILASYEIYFDPENLSIHIIQNQVRSKII